MPPRGSTAARGYGSEHAKARKAWAAVVSAGQAVCTRCQRPVLPGMLWDLDHLDDRSGYAGAAHRACNRRAGAVKGNRRRAARRRPRVFGPVSTSRQW